jgi:tetratricopeptide (TPR) repeat protein
LAAEGISGFAPAFREAVADATRRLRKLKKELARDCGMRPDRFSHLQSGLRRPTHAEVVGIGKGLRLDESATNRLLGLAGFPPLSRPPAPVPEATSLVPELGAPEHDLARAEIDDDLGRVRGAWAHYGHVQGRNQDREWSQASALYEEGIEHYWALRSMAARYLAQMNLAAATACEHLNKLSEAEARCRDGLAAAVASGSRPFQVMLLSRLGSIERHRSNYEEAGRHYERALEVLDEWHAGEMAGTDRRMGRDWHAHWTARIQRMQGWLEMHKGRPAEALRKLEPSLEHFKRVMHRYELAQVCYGLGWAHALRGDLEGALSWNSQGLAYAQEHSRASGRADDRSLLQGHVFLGGDHLETGDLPSARTHLEEAARLAAGRRLGGYLEVGRVQLLLGELEMKEGRWQVAHEHLRRALDFFSEGEELVRLATAHNVMGDFYLESGRGRQDLQAADHYQKALQAARASRPPNSYYECAALVNLCRVRVRGNLSLAELADLPDRSVVSESGRDLDALIAEAREIGRANRYRNHLARLAVVEAELALRRGDHAGAARTAGDALHLAHNFSPQVHKEVRENLRYLGLSEELLDAPLVADDGG